MIFRDDDGGSEIPQAPEACPACNAPLEPDARACGACQRLVHKAALESLAQQAQPLESQRPQEAVLLWRQALRLLPPDSNQFRQIEARVGRLSEARPAPVEPVQKEEEAKRGMPRLLAALGGVGLLLWKVKPVLLFVGGKGKLLLVGLTKWKTMLSMFIMLGVYWSIWGWWFALGFVLSIYVHEIGHVAMLRHYGIAASAPMFIPGLGAFVRLKEYPANVIEDARIGLAGPWWGLGAAVACYGAFLATGQAVFAAIAQVGGWINLFNLVPIWQLDGGRGFRALTRTQRWWAVGVVALVLLYVGEPLLWLLLLGGIFRAVKGPYADKPDLRGLLSYGFLVVVLAVMTTIQIPGVEPGEHGFPVAVAQAPSSTSEEETEDLTLEAVRALVDARYSPQQWMSRAELLAKLADETGPAPALLDVRTHAEFRVSHLAGAVRVDPDEPRLADLGLPRDRTIVVYCSVGYRSGAIALALQELGFERVYNLEGGIFGWANGGHPLERDGRPVSEVHPYDSVWGRLLDETHRAELDR